MKKNYKSFAALMGVLLLTNISTAQDIFRLSDPTINTCDGILLDSGGNQFYGPNEDFVTTICPGPTGDTHVRIRLIEFDFGEGDVLTFFDGDDANAPVLTALRSSDENLFQVNGTRIPVVIQASAQNATGCITIQFTSDATDQGEGFFGEITCVPSCQPVLSELTNSSPVVMPADTGYINACIGSEISLSATGIYPQNNLFYSQSDATSQFEWDFGDGERAVGQNVSHTYDRSGGFIVQVRVTDSKGCESTNFITQRVRIAPKPSFDFAGDLNEAVCVKDTIDLSLTSIAPNEGIFGRDQVLSDTLALPDGDGTSYQTDLEFTQFRPGQTLENAEDLQRVCVNMEHSWLRDLEIRLFCPSGESVVLHDFVSEQGTQISLGEPIRFGEDLGVGYDYCWRPGAPNGTWLDYSDNILFNGATLPSGDYAPAEPYDSLIGCPLNGRWTIQVTDKWTVDNGFIFSWGIDFNPDLFPEIETFTPNIVSYDFNSILTTIEQNSDSLKAVAQTAGDNEFVFEVTDDYGCTFDTTLTVEVLPVSDIRCHNCMDNLIATTDTTVCDGAAVQLDAEPSTLPEILEFSFLDNVNRDFGKIDLPRNTELPNSLTISGVVPNQITTANTDILSICIDMEIDGAAPFTVEVESPSGERMTLVQQGITGRFQNVCFEPDATNDLLSTTPPFNGAFQPSGDWADLDGANMNGDWQLIISSLAGDIDAGRINYWSITFQGRNQTTYAWTPATGLSCTDCADPVATPTATTTYTVEVSNEIGCSYTDQINVNVDPTLNTMVVDGITVEPVNCFNGNTGSAEVNISGGNMPYQYIWDDELAQISQKAVFLPAGTYEVTVTDDIGCRRFATATIEEPDSLIVNLTPTDILCRDEASGQIVADPVGGTGPYQYNWSNSFNDRVNESLIAGNYSVTITDNNGCIAMSQATLMEPAEALSVNINQLEFGCFGTQSNEAEALVQGGNSASYTFSWSNGQTDAIATGLDTITYTVTVTDANGCETTSNITPEDLEAIDFEIIQSRPTCFGDQDGRLAINSLSGGAGSIPDDYTIDWSTGQSGEFIENLAGSQTYAVTVTDIIGCMTVKERQLEEPNPISFDITPTMISCFGLTDGSATVENIRGAANNSNVTFQWDANAGGSSTATASNLGPNSYNVVVTDERGCNTEQSITIEEPSAILINLQPEDNDCFGESLGSITSNISGGAGSYTYLWSNNENGPNLNNLPAGNYEVTVTDANGCIETQMAIVNQPDSVFITLAGTDPTCFGDLNGQILVTASGGSGPYTYSLDGDAYLTSNRLIGLGATNYTVYVSDINGCVVTKNIRLSEPPEFDIFVGSPGTTSDYDILLGDSLALTINTVNAQGQVSFNWIAPYEGTLNCDSCQTVIAQPGNSITYQVRAVDERGCRANDLVKITVEKLRNLEVPTGFTPNSDNTNDLLLVHGRPGTTVKLFRVFDRWGELLYEAKDFEVNSTSVGWDGTFRGMPVSPDTYIWFLEAEFIDGSTEIYRGQTNLIR